MGTVGDAPLVDPEYQGRRFYPQKDYWRIIDRSCVLADSQGRVYLHRYVLYKAIGGGPHRCGLCGRDGLDWTATGDDRIEVDHKDQNRSNNRRENLRPAHKWCNGNRYLIEANGIPWETFTDQPIADRIAIRIAGGPNTGQLTPAAQKLIARLANTDQGENNAEPLDGSAKVREGLTNWTELVDGKRALKAPPALTEKYGWLEGIG